MNAPTTRAAINSLVDHYADPSGPYVGCSLEHRRGGTFGLQALDVRQGAVETVDSAVSEVAIVTGMSVSASGEVDFGDGWRSRSLRAGVVDIHPACTDVGFRLPALHLRIITVGQDALCRCLDIHGLAPSRLGAVTGEFRFLPTAAGHVDRIWRASEGLGGAASLAVDAAFL